MGGQHVAPGAYGASKSEWLIGTVDALDPAIDHAYTLNERLIPGETDGTDGGDCLREIEHNTTHNHNTMNTPPSPIFGLSPNKHVLDFDSFDFVDMVNELRNKNTLNELEVDQLIHRMAKLCANDDEYATGDKVMNAVIVDPPSTSIPPKPPPGSLLIVILQDHHHPLMCVISHILISNPRIMITNWAQGLLIISQSLALTKQL